MVIWVNYSRRRRAGRGRVGARVSSDWFRNSTRVVIFSKFASFKRRALCLLARKVAIRSRSASAAKTTTQPIMIVVFELMGLGVVAVLSCVLVPDIQRYHAHTLTVIHYQYFSSKYNMILTYEFLASTVIDGIATRATIRNHHKCPI
jgi:hypothetical protein